MSEYVTIQELADDWGMARTNARKYVLKQGFTFASIRTPDTRGQATLALSSEDAEAVREVRRRQGFLKGAATPIENGDGYFYIVQVVPELEPRRVKLGWTYDIDSRLSAHRTAAPTAQLVRAWPCKKSWEGTAMASLTRCGCQLIANEVYTCDNVEAITERADQFFSLLPR